MVNALGGTGNISEKLRSSVERQLSGGSSVKRSLPFFACIARNAASSGSREDDAGNPAAISISTTLGAATR